MRRARAAYRRRAGELAAAMPGGGPDASAELFDTLQHDAYQRAGWAGLVRCWAAEWRGLALVRNTMNTGSKVSLWHGLAHDVRDAWRGLLRAPGAALVIIATLALGVGMNTAVFSVVDAVLFKQLPYAGVDRLVRVAEWPKTGGNFTVAPYAFLAWRGRETGLDRLEARRSVTLVHLGADGPEAERALAVTPGYLELFGARPALGRLFADADAAVNGDCRVIVSHQMWVRRLGARPDAVGETVPFAGRSCTLIGILPADSAFDRSEVQLYLPLGFDAGSAADNGRSLTVVGRLAPGTTIERAYTSLASVAATVNADRGRAGEGWNVALTPWRDVVVRSDSRTMAWALFGAVSLVLLVACVNVAGLSIARAVQRRREWAVRLALGAGPWRALRALIVEGLMLAAIGEVLALVLGALFLRALLAWLPPGTVPSEAQVSLDARALAFASAVSVLAALASATAPIWRTRKSPLVESLRDGRGNAGSRAGSRLYAGLLVAEVASAMLLAAGASLLVASFVRLVNVNPGFSTDDVLTMRVSLPADRYDSEAAQSEYFARALDSVRGVPGVQRAAIVTSLPLGGWLYGTPIDIAEQPITGVRPSAHIQAASDDYFATLGIALSEGREFTPRDAARARLVAVVNETFVRKFLPPGPALGRHVVMDVAVDGHAPTSWEIVGVIRSVKTNGLAEAAFAVPEIYVPHRQSPIGTMFLAVKSAPGADVTRQVRAALTSVDPQVPAGDVQTMAERVGVSVRTQRFRAGLIGMFAGLAAVLACVGVYGVRSRAVAARRREMGIRLAMGASRRELLSLVVGEGMKLVAVGMALGLAGAFLLSRALSQWLFATPPADPRALGIATLLLGGAALLAGYVPARRAARVDPLVIFRADG
jgi:predicted permease